MHTQPTIASLDVPALPLQLVLRKHPAWGEDPLVIVGEDSPTAPVQWANKAAREHRIDRGLPFSQAKTLAAKLRAAMVPEHEITQAVDTLFEVLLRYSPHVEPAEDLPGLFFLDPSGLGGLFGDYQAWGQQVHNALTALGFRAALAIGYSRPSLYALSRTGLRARVHVSRSHDEESALADRVPLSALHLPPKIIEQMALLGVHTVGDLLALPASQLRRRYGAELAHLHQFLSGQSFTPLQPRIPVEPLVLTLEVEPPDADMTRLLFGIKGLLHTMLPRLLERCEAITALTLHFDLEYAVEQSAPVDECKERVETAAPTLELLQLIELLRLRFSELKLPAPCCMLTLTVESVRVHPKQLHLQQARQRRDLAAAGRALSRIKAKFGDEAVTRAKLREAHLPEASFTFELCSDVNLPHPPFIPHQMPLVRRLSPRNPPLPHLPGQTPRAGLLQEAHIKHMFGPYRISGGWWSRLRERDYYFVETKHDELLWTFYDRPRKRWFIHGAVR